MPKILHFEDDSFLANMYRVKFTLEGFEYKNYECPFKDPVKLVKKENPDLIIMDIIMPRMDGYHATELLKSDKDTEKIPIFGLCNMGQPEHVKKALDLGMIDYWITAHHMPDEVVNKVKSILGMPEKPKEKIFSPLEPNYKRPSFFDLPIKESEAGATDRIRESIVTSKELKRLERKQEKVFQKEELKSTLNSNAGYLSIISIVVGVILSFSSSSVAGAIMICFGMGVLIGYSLRHHK